MNDHTPILNWNRIFIFFEWYIKMSSIWTRWCHSGFMMPLGPMPWNFNVIQNKLLLMKIEPCISQAFLKCSEAKFAKEVFHFNRHTKQFVNLVYELVIEMEHPPLFPYCYSYIYQFVVKHVMANFGWIWDSQSVTVYIIAFPVLFVFQPTLYMYMQPAFRCSFFPSRKHQSRKSLWKSTCPSTDLLCSDYTQAGKRSDIWRLFNHVLLEFWLG